ncbi:hypothetical protein V2W45_1471450 [Cenococcum geophilum]
MPKYGLVTLYTAVKPKADIVFVHGLRDRYLWPRDFLAADLKNSRIMSFGYDSNIIYSDTAEVTQGSLESDARSLCALLSAERSTPDSKDQPIILVAHSLGGLVCTEAIVLGERNATGDSVQSIAKRVNGIVFLGTPFAGLNLAKWGDIIRAIFNVTIRKRNNTTGRVRIVFFYETLPTHGVMVFASNNDNGYKVVKEKIVKMMQGCQEDNLWRYHLS